MRGGSSQLSVMEANYLVYVVPYRPFGGLQRSPTRNAVCVCVYVRVWYVARMNALIRYNPVLGLNLLPTLILLKPFGLPMQKEVMML